MYKRKNKNGQVFFIRLSDTDQLAYEVRHRTGWFESKLLGRFPVYDSRMLKKYWGYNTPNEARNAAIKYIDEIIQTGEK